VELLEQREKEDLINEEDGAAELDAQQKEPEAAAVGDQVRAIFRCSAQFRA
jgi:hypothetical protein